jgi:ferrous iron transport protein A
MSAGQRATLADIVGQPEQVQRLKELGFHQGVNLEMVRSGSPCIVRLGGNKLCIRGNELLNVLVECED